MVLVAGVEDGLKGDKNVISRQEGRRVEPKCLQGTIPDTHMLEDKFHGGGGDGGQNYYVSWLSNCVDGRDI